MSYEFGLNHIKEKFKKIEAIIGKESEINIDTVRLQLGITELEEKIAKLGNLTTEITEIRQKIVNFENKFGNEINQFSKL